MFLAFTKGLIIQYELTFVIFKGNTIWGAGEGGLGTAHEINIKVWDGSLSGRKEAKGEITPWGNFFFFKVKTFSRNLERTTVL